MARENRPVSAPGRCPSRRSLRRARPGLVGMGLARYLRSNMGEDGTIFDEFARQPAPDSHYAHTFFAWAAVSAWTRTGDETWLSCAEEAVRYYLSLPKSKRGHGEFNAFALLGILDSTSRVNHPSSHVLRETALRALQEVSFRSAKDPDISNNWVALALACRARSARLGETVGPSFDPAAILDWQLEDGIFADWKKGSRDVATPLTYHAAICAFLSDYLINDPIEADPAARSSLLTGLKPLLETTSPEGRFGFFGRSTESLFGYACGVWALHNGSKIFPQNSNRLLATCGLLVSHLHSCQRPDGGIHPIPSMTKFSKRWMDSYVYQSVYDAFAAATLLNIPDFSYGPVLGAPRMWHGHASGILTIRGRWFIAVSTRGQIADYSPHFHDPRYYGMRPLFISWGGRPLIPSPHLLRSTRHDSEDPRQVDFVPSIRLEGETYAARTYKEIRIRIGHQTVISGKAAPSALKTLPRPAGRRGRVRRIFTPAHWVKLQMLANVRLDRVITARKAAIAITDLVRNNSDTRITYSCRFSTLHELVTSGRDEFRMPLPEGDMLVHATCNMQPKTISIEHSMCPWGRKYTVVISGEVAPGSNFSSFLIAESPAQMDHLYDILRSLSSSLRLSPRPAQELSEVIT